MTTPWTPAKRPAAPAWPRKSTSLWTTAESRLPTTAPASPPPPWKAYSTIPSAGRSREAYVSPTRGAQGNALKTILAMPFVLDGAQGQVDISAQGQRHEIIFRVDQIRQEPAISHTTHPRTKCKNRDQDQGTLAGFSLLKTGRRQGPFFTTCRRLHVAEPPLDANRGLVRAAARRPRPRARRGASGARASPLRRTGTARRNSNA